MGTLDVPVTNCNSLALISLSKFSTALQVEGRERGRDGGGREGGMEGGREGGGMKGGRGT